MKLANMAAADESHNRLRHGATLAFNDLQAVYGGVANPWGSSRSLASILLLAAYGGNHWGRYVAILRRRLLHTRTD